MAARSILSAPVVVAVANTGELIRHGSELFQVDKEAARDFFRTMEIQSSAAAVENLLLAATSLGIGSVWLGILFLIKREVLDFLELYDYRKQTVGSLPYGVQKLVGLSRALVMDPDLLLVDELSSGLTRESKEDIARFLLRIQHETRTTIVWVEHDIKLLGELANRLLCLDFGRKIKEGFPSEVLSDPSVVEKYMGEE